VVRVVALNTIDTPILLQWIKLCERVEGLHRKCMYCHIEHDFVYSNREHLYHEWEKCVGGKCDDAFSHYLTNLSLRFHTTSSSKWVMLPMQTYAVERILLLYEGENDSQDLSRFFTSIIIRFYLNDFVS